MCTHNGQVMRVKTLAIAFVLVLLIPEVGYSQDAIASTSSEFRTFEARPSPDEARESQDRSDSYKSPEMKRWEHRLAPRIGTEFHFGVHRVGVPRALHDGPRQEDNLVRGSFTGLQLGSSLVWRHTAPVEIYGNIEPANSMRLGLGLMAQGGMGQSGQHEVDLVNVYYGQLGIHAVIGYQVTFLPIQTPNHIKTLIYGFDWMPVLFRGLLYEQAAIYPENVLSQTQNDLGRMNLTQFRLFAGPSTFNVGRTSDYDVRLECTVNPWRVLGARSRSISLGLTLTRK